MAKITAAEVNKLRKATGAGMMDCKKALVEADGDFDSAIEILRKKGQKVAANRADRESSEGAVIATVNADNTRGVIVSLNCETDFVAKNDSFVQMAQDFANLALDVNSKEELLAKDYNGLTVQEKLTEQTGLLVRRSRLVTSELLRLLSLDLTSTQVTRSLFLQVFLQRLTMLKKLQRMFLCRQLL